MSFTNSKVPLGRGIIKDLVGIADEQSKYSHEEKRIILKTLAGKKGYVTTDDLNRITFTRKKQRKHACQEKARRFVKEGLLFPAEFKPQRYYLTAESAAEAIANKPKRKQIDLYELHDKYVVRQAPPSRAAAGGPNQEITHENKQIEHSLVRHNYTNDNNPTIVLTAAELAAGKKHIRYQNYGELGLRVKDAFGSGFYDALDKIPLTPILAHNLSFTFNTPSLPPPELFADIPRHNNMQNGRVRANGISIHYEIYPTGKVNVKPHLTWAPIPPHTMGLLMSAIKQVLPFNCPPTDNWLITTTDANFDIPIPKGEVWIKTFHLDEFEYKGSRIHLYSKKINGKYHLRVESHDNPHVTLLGYREFIESASTKLLDLCGKSIPSQGGLT